MNEAIKVIFVLLVSGTVSLFSCIQMKKVTIVDGCEYVKYKSGKQSGLIHNENCKNKIHLK